MGLVIVLMQTGGEALEKLAEGKASDALRALEKASPKIVHLVRGDSVADVDVDDVQQGDVILVRAGEMVPCDGTVTEGSSHLDTASITGEPVPRKIEAGSPVMSGCINQNGPVRIRVSAIAAESQYARIVALVRGAQASKAPLQRLADRYAVWFTPATLVDRVHPQHEAELLLREAARRQRRRPADGTSICLSAADPATVSRLARSQERDLRSWLFDATPVGDGVLVIVAKNDRKVRIEVAKTLEGAIPDLAAKHIIDEAITPAFRKGDFAGGLRAGADQLIARINGEPLPAPERKAERSSVGGGFNWMDLAIFLFFAVPFGEVFVPTWTTDETSAALIFSTSSVARTDTTHASSSPC